MMKDIKDIISEGLIGSRTRNITSIKDELEEVGRHILSGSRIKRAAPIKREGCMNRAMDAVDKMHEIVSSSFKRLTPGSEWTKEQWEDELVLSFYIKGHELRPGFFEVAWPLWEFYAHYSLSSLNVLEPTSKADYLYSFGLADRDGEVAARLRRSAFYEVYSIKEGPLRKLIEECILYPLCESVGGTR